MIAVQIMLLAGVFIAFSNYCMRRSVDAGGTTKAFLTIQLFIVFCIAVLLNPVRNGDYQWNGCMAAFGVAGGLVLACMMASLGRALELGPPGLTFAALNSSTVMPAIIMLLIFGGAFGYRYTIAHAMGSLLVICGLFWAGWQSTCTEKKLSWIGFVISAFFLHVIFLVFLSWRALFIRFPGAEGLLLSFDVQDAKSQWFMPMVFFTAFIAQFFIFSAAERRMPNLQESLFGLLGGIANGIGTFFMIVATEKASPLEHAMIYPIFSVSVILLCNLWGQWLYRETVNWKANLLCIAGIFIGTIDWGVF